MIYMFNNSANSKKVFKYFNDKFGQKIAPVGLAKVVCMVSPHVNKRKPYVSIFHVAPTRQFKSRTSFEALKILPKKYAEDMGDDVTMHSIMNKYRGKIGRKCLSINDGTTLFASKGKRTKERLISGLAVLLSEGTWFYGDRQSPENTLTGDISILMNMTLESYLKYESRLLGSTFLERFTTLFYMLPMIEMEEYTEEFEKKSKLEFGKKVTFRKTDVINLEDYKKVLIEYAKRWSALSMKSFNGCFDQIEGLINAHIALNRRRKLLPDDLDFLRMLEPYLINPISPNINRIITLHRQGRSNKDICLVLGKSPTTYAPYVSRILKKARVRGVVS